jgi:16S rRNA (guanine(1405)-N(7))-methyltransferase
MNLSDNAQQAILERILDTKKYRGLGLNPETVLDLIRQEALDHVSEKSLYKSVRKKLHNIVAPYLGEPDYLALTERLNQIPNPTPDSPAIQALCLDALKAHASTAERISYQTEFYQALFEEIGYPQTILDLACGLHPLAFPWMGLPLSTDYHAFDILQPRIDFINAFFGTIGLKPLAINQDILVHPPAISADLGLFLKEAHRFEKRQPGCNRDFWERLSVKTLVVSLPTRNLTGAHSLLAQHQALAYANLPKNASVRELLFEDEVVFLINKEGG